MLERTESVTALGGRKRPMIRTQKTRSLSRLGRGKRSQRPKTSLWATRTGVVGKVVCWGTLVLTKNVRYEKASLTRKKRPDCPGSFRLRRRKPYGKEIPRTTPVFNPSGVLGLDGSAERELGESLGPGTFQVIIPTYKEGPTCLLQGGVGGGWYGDASFVGFLQMK